MKIENVMRITMNQFFKYDEEEEEEELDGGPEGKKEGAAPTTVDGNVTVDLEGFDADESSYAETSAASADVAS